MAKQDCRFDATIIEWCAITLADHILTHTEKLGLFQEVRVKLDNMSSTNSDDID
jgi:hypothetical protein